MKQALKFTLTTALLALSFAPGLTGLDKAKVKAEIQKAVGHFMDPNLRSSDCQTAFLLLVGAVEQAAPESGFPASFGATITKARQVFESTSIMNRDGVNLLNEAYAAINDGLAFRFPEQLTGPDAILAYSEKLSAGAQKSLEAGQTGAAVKSVLEILLMIVTPVQATH
jgi:hypothetical protein